MTSDDPAIGLAEKVSEGNMDTIKLTKEFCDTKYDELSPSVIFSKHLHN